LDTNYDEYSYEHVITENKTYDKPGETGGGIVADDMGLGKTLTMLATIVATLNDSITFQSASTTTLAKVNDEASIYRARATLVLVPSQSTYPLQYFVA
jgi:SWI/SNF-related matrix-associated actin-dependent regulator of chromatin subfamily A3